MLEKLKRFNLLAFVAMAGLVVIGTLAIRSAGGARAEVVFHGMWRANLAMAFVGLAVYFALALADYRVYLPLAAVPAYVVSVVLLVAVLLVGSEVYGGKRWLWFFQPSEIAKICVIALLAFVYGDGSETFRRRMRSFAGFALACVLVGVPALLILKEPDLGTTLTLVPAVLVMLLAARVWRRGLLSALAMAGLAAAVVLGAVREAEKPGVGDERRAKIMKYVPLRPHQVKRVRVFLNPEEDIAGAGYNLRQAMISIGTGGLRGKGLGKGENNHLKYLPQSISMNDFIFCVWAEETGFLGSLLLLGLFGVLLVASAWAAFRATDDCGRLLALGVSTLIFAHVFINIAMSVGLVPITGLPLPFISSGRTFLLVVMVGLGLVQSVSIYGREENRKS